jgi:hypothetical protein
MQGINGLQAGAIAAALAQAGGVWTPFYRQATDGNGVPTGEPVRMGCLLGKRYTKGQASTLRIDIPGVIATRDVTRFEGVLANGCAPPQAGDQLCVGANARVKITGVNTDAAPLYVLTLDM